MPIDISNNQLNSVGANVLAYSSVVTSGLVMYLDAGIANSYPGTGTSWLDLSGNNYTETLTNGPTYSTGNGGYISFDGTDDYATRDFAGNFISNPTLNSNIISFGCWCYAIGGLYIISSGAQTSSTGIAFSYQSGSPFYAIKGTNVGGFGYISSPGTNFPTNTWINWMFVSDGSTLKAYKNGVYLEQTTISAESNSDIYTALTLGVPNNNLTNYLFNGRIANVFIYNKALSASEVLQNFNANRRRFNI